MTESRGDTEARGDGGRVLRGFKGSRHYYASINATLKGVRTMVNAILSVR